MKVELTQFARLLLVTAAPTDCADWLGWGFSTGTLKELKGAVWGALGMNACCEGKPPSCMLVKSGLPAVKRGMGVGEAISEFMLKL